MPENDASKKQETINLLFLTSIKKYFKTRLGTFLSIITPTILLKLHPNSKNISNEVVY
jgi:hypothetical protein